MKATWNLTVLMTLVALALLFQNCSQQLEESKGSSQIAGCPKPAGVNTSPQTIADAVTLINALPKPLSVACFISVLDRPLEIYATASTASAQPAYNERSPRIFLFTGNLVISIVPEGPGRDLVEFSEFKGGPERTLKGELHFPVLNSLTAAAPFDRIRLGSGTTCFACHRNEGRDTSITYATAYISDVIRPFAPFRVDPNQLQMEQENCVTGVEGLRCDILSAVFLHGSLTERDFGRF